MTRILTENETNDIKEVRTMVMKLPEAAKVEIIKGMAMFEAGYTNGFIDGMNKRNDKPAA